MNTGIITPEDLKRANQRCEWWLARAIGGGYGAGHGEPTRSPHIRKDNNLVGAITEVAYAKHFNLPMPHDNEFGLGDFGSIQVRGTWHRNGHLIVFDSEPTEGRIFVLVTATRITYCIVGEAPGDAIARLGERPGKRVRPGSPPQLWVHQTKLRPHLGGAK
jgi:hypothetical protein